MDGDRTETIPTTLRLLLVVERIAAAGGPVTPTAVNAEMGLPKPTIHRLFGTLEAEGFLRRDLDGRGYVPAPRLLRMAAGLMAAQGPRTARLAILQRLSREIGETCNIALPDGDAMVYLDRVETEWPLRIQLPVGTRVPLYCTASGKMYLASLAPAQLDGYLAAADLAPRGPGTLTDPGALRAEIARVRADGCALDREEFMADMVALAVPVAAPDGRLLATLSFHAPTQRLGAGQALSALPALRAAAGRLAALVAGPEG